MFTKFALKGRLANALGYMIDKFACAQIALERAIVGYGGVVGHTLAIRYVIVFGAFTAVTTIGFGAEYAQGAHLFAGLFRAWICNWKTIKN